MSDCEHKWRLMRVPYECPYCLREKISEFEAERDALRAAIQTAAYGTRESDPAMSKLLDAALGERHE